MNSSLISGPDGSWTVQCTFCRLRFASVEEMEKHQDESHVDAMKCNYCGKVFRGYRLMQWHMRAVHNAKMRSSYECSQCGNTPLFVSTLKKEDA